MHNFDNEIPKHRNKKESSTSKSKTKSKHKHEYIDCLLIESGKPHKATYCKICGKIGDVKFFETEPCGDACSRVLTYKEVFTKYRNLEQLEVDNIWQKFVSISK